MSARRKWARTPPGPGLVSSADVVAVTGLSYRQLDHWARAGLAHPRPDPDMATGHSRWWPLAEVQRLAVMARLVGAGFEPAAAGTVADTACVGVAPSASVVAVVDVHSGVRVMVTVTQVAE